MILGAFYIIYNFCKIKLIIKTKYNMKILIEKNQKKPEVTIDVSNISCWIEIRNALKLALQIEGFTDSDIREIFHEYPTHKVLASPNYETDIQDDTCSRVIAFLYNRKGFDDWWNRLDFSLKAEIKNGLNAILK